MRHLFKMTALLIAVLPLGSAFAANQVRANAVKLEAHNVSPKSTDQHTVSTQLSKQVAFIKHSTQGQVTILRSFKTSVKGLVGFVIQSKEKEAHPIVAYVNSDASYMVVGAVLNKDGLNINYQYTQKYVSSIASRTAFSSLDSTYGFLEGSKNAPHTLNVIADPNCSFCHQFYNEVQPFIKNGSLAVNWIMVGIIKRSSVSKAAQIMASKNPRKMLAQDEKYFDVQHESGGISGLSSIPADLTEKLKANKQYMVSNGFIGTPVLIFKFKGEPRVIEGYISAHQFKGILPNISDSF